MEGEDKIKESIKSCIESYTAFVDALDDNAQPISDFLEDTTVQSFPLLRQLCIPRELNCSQAQADLSFTRYERLLGLLKQCQKVLNTRVDVLGDQLLEKVAEFHNYYQSIHLLYVFSSLITEGLNLFCTHNSNLRTLRDLELQLGNLEIAEELRIHFSLFTADTSSIKQRKISVIIS